MTIDEAIKHCEEKAKENNEIYKAHCQIYGKDIVENYPKPECKKCAEEHEQLAEWLKELKALKENKGDLISRDELQSWLYEIVMNNMDGSEKDKVFADCVVEIIDRLDGFERYVEEKRREGEA